MVVERGIDMPLTAYPQDRLRDRIGKVHGGSCILDSERRGFEKMETGGTPVALTSPSSGSCV
jgi:hypothetical protein